LASKFSGASGLSGSVFVRAVNGLAVWLLDVPVPGGLMRRGLVEVRYVGRRSGKTFEIPVGYRRSGDTITVGVSMPDGKNWWRTSSVRVARSPSSAWTAWTVPDMPSPHAMSEAVSR
jgi:hypothetical protein